MILGRDSASIKPKCCKTGSHKAGAEPVARPLVVVMLRGAIDGLSVVVPHDEPDYYRLRPDIAIARPGKDHPRDRACPRWPGRRRAHAVGGHAQRRIWRFLVDAFPALFRAEWKVIALSAVLLFAGAGVGAVGIAVDPGSRAVLIPEQHQAFSPDERVTRDEGQVASAGEASVFSAFLFTHNIRVTFLVFALGITFGVGTALVLFYNGLPLGALAMQYHLAGEGLFFWAWILPHGIPELTQIFIAGGAGLMIGRGMLLPGRRRRGRAVQQEARKAVLLVVGGMPILVLAGIIEGTISQIHAPTLPYWVKLAVAIVVGVGLYAYLLRAGRGSDAEAAQASERSAV